MKKIENLNKKRVFDMTEDDRKIVLQTGKCTTTVTVNPDGTLHVQRSYSAM